MSHYFAFDPSLKSRERILDYELEGEKFSFTTDTNVFSNKAIDKGSTIFVEELLKEDLSGEALDLGCGYGFVAICLKKRFSKLTIAMSDINVECVKLARKNAIVNGVDIASFYVSDGFEKIASSFDYVFLNPPIRCGNEIIFRLYEESHSHLKEEGKLFIVIRKDKGAKGHVRYLSSLFSKVDVICKEKGYRVVESAK
jgi:16S rRNA (guanine1207-N2)-methyltransferase